MFTRSGPAARARHILHPGARPLDEDGGRIGVSLVMTRSALRTARITRGSGPMSFCEHCEGQRFDRARVLRALRATRKPMRRHSRADEALRAAIAPVRGLDLPHLDRP